MTNKNMVEKKVPNTIPIFSIGIVFFIMSIFFPPYKLTNLLINTIISIISYIVLKMVFKDKIIYEEAPSTPADTGDEEINKLINKGREQLGQLALISKEIKNEKLKVQISEQIGYGEKIFDYISKNTNQARQIKTFMDYYLPTTVELLENYKYLEEQDVRGENIEKSMVKIEEIMDMVVDAFSKQLDNLFANKAIDIVSEVNVMKRIIESEGLSENVIPFDKAGEENA